MAFKQYEFDSGASLKYEEKKTQQLQGNQWLSADRMAPKYLGGSIDAPCASKVSTKEYSRFSAGSRSRLQPMSFLNKDESPRPYLSLGRQSPKSNMPPPT